ncbi:7020_t:CDS:2, partial [Racocetra persica]
ASLDMVTKIDTLMEDLTEILRKWEKLNNTDKFKVNDDKNEAADSRANKFEKVSVRLKDAFLEHPNIMRILKDISNIKYNMRSFVRLNG